MTRKPNLKTKDHSRPKRKSARQSNRSPETEFRKSVLKVRLDAFQIAALKKLAKEHGTTLAQEFDNAVDAYVLGVSQEEIRTLNALVDQLKEATANAKKTVDEALRKTKKTRAHSARKKRTKHSARLAGLFTETDLTKNLTPAKAHADELAVQRPKSRQSSGGTGKSRHLPSLKRFRARTARSDASSSRLLRKERSGRHGGRR